MTEAVNDQADALTIAWMDGHARGKEFGRAKGTEGRVCEDIARRQALGIAKYGTTVEANPLALRAWLQHAYEEALDQAVYLRRAMEELDRRAEGGQ